MQETHDIPRKAEALRVLMEKHMGVKASSFARAVKKAGRRLPRRLRKQAAVIAEAETFATNPKLIRRIDSQLVARAHDDITAHLVALDLADQRKGRLLNILAAIALNVLILIVLVIVVLRWRGLV